jgi:hypothetical protein
MELGTLAHYHSRMEDPLMTRSFRTLRSVLISLLAIGIAAPQALVAQSRVVSPSELRDAVRQRAGERERNLEQVRAFFADPKIAGILRNAHLDSGRIERAIATLDSGELEKLAARTVQIQKDFAAGALSNQELTYVVIAIGAAVLVLIVVVA